MLDIKTNIIIFMGGLMFLLSPLFAWAANESQFSAITNFTINTSNTATPTDLSVSAGSQVTLLNVQPNYIDITLDNLSTITFSVATSSRYFKIVKQSGSSAYTINPTCPTNSATLTGSGAQVVLRLTIQTTNNCVTPPPPPAGGGGGGGPTPDPYTPPAPYVAPIVNPVVAPVVPVVAPTQTICPPGDLFSSVTGQRCTSYSSVTAPTDCRPGDLFSMSTGKSCPQSVPTYSPVISSSSTSCSAYLTLPIRSGIVNNSLEVKKLQKFLHDYEGYSNISETGIYDALTLNAVKMFQTKYAQDILTPASLSSASGIVGPSTRTKVNSIYCSNIKNNQVTVVSVPPVNINSAPITPVIPVTSASSISQTRANCYFTRNLSFGFIGEDVRCLQQFLNSRPEQIGSKVAISGAGSAGNETSVFDANTKAALIRYQNFFKNQILIPAGLTSGNGVFGAITRNFVNSLK